MNNLKIQFLGTRGSIPVSSKKYSIYGGATACTLITVNNQHFIFDAGSGFLNLPDYINFNKDSNHILHLFLSHAHLDHILGLLACKCMFDSRITIHIYGKKRLGLTIKEQLEQLLQPPIWPVGVDMFTSTVIFHDLTRELEIDEVNVSFIEGCHPGGCTAFRMEYHSTSLVYATDYEITEQNMDQLIAFSKNSNLLICDGQYSDANIVEKSGFGHSAWQSAVSIAQQSCCEHLCISHHDPYSDDEYLAVIEDELHRLSPTYFLAKEGRSITL